jgi:hypothetical protein
MVPGRLLRPQHGRPHTVPCGALGRAVAQPMQRESRPDGQRQGAGVCLPGSLHRDLSAWQLLAVVLVVLLAVGLLFAQVKLPPEVQSLVGDEEATLGIGLAVTLAITQNRKK